MLKKIKIKKDFLYVKKWSFEKVLLFFPLVKSYLFAEQE